MEAQQLLRRVAGLPTQAQTMAATAATAAARTTRIHSFPLVLSSSFLPSSSLPAGRRYKATASRTKRSLNIAPHASFGGKKFQASGASVLGKFGGSSSAAATATLLYNPPASAPSVYQTPFKFLPRSDPRRKSNLMSLFASSTPSSSSDHLSPILPTRHLAPDRKKYHLTEADVAEMRRLRTTDPIQWSVLRLAQHFDCSAIFVMKVVQSSREHRAQIQEGIEAVRKRWGPIRTRAKEERAKRREMLFNGEL